MGQPGAEMLRHLRRLPSGPRNSADNQAVKTAIQVRKREPRRRQERPENPKVLLDGPGPATEEEKAANDKQLINSRGPTADYLTARIARDHPAVLERMKAGDFPS